MELAHLRKIALSHALRLGLSRQDAEDCASCFVLQHLEKEGPILPLPPSTSSLPDHTEAWRQRCARNYALNFHRGQQRYRQHLVPSANFADESYSTIPSLDRHTLPLVSCLLQEFREEVGAVLDLLPERTRCLFVGYHLEGRSLDALAHEQEMQPNAVSQTLFRARTRLRQQLELRGWTRDELSLTLQTNS